jgi:hypothetical protein
MLGEYHERTGRLADAERCFEMIRERYEDSDDLLAFYHRAQQRPGGTRYRGKFEEERAEIFPEGLERLPSPAPSAAPTEGVVMAEETDHARRLGLEPGVVIVGLDGWRTRNMRQYFVVRSFTRDPEMHFEVWRRGRYETKTLRLPRRRFDLNMRDLAPAPPRR